MQRRYRRVILLGFVLFLLVGLGSVQAVDLIITGTGSSGHAIKDEGGTALQQRPTLDCIGAGITCQDDSASNSTQIRVPGATALRVLTVANTATTINVDCDDYDQVWIANLTQAATVAAPQTCVPNNGQELTYAIASAAAQTLTFSTAAQGFATSAGKPLPTTTIAGKTLVVVTRWNSGVNLWEVKSLSWEHVKVQGTTTSTSVTIDSDSTELYRLTAQTTAVTFNNPTGTPRDDQSLRIAICSATSQTITWGSEFNNAYIATIPTTTTGGGKCDMFGFRRDTANTRWVYLTTTQDPIGNRRRECPIPIGSENGPTLSDADITTTLGCPVHGAATIEQVTVRSMCANTPSVMVHRCTATCAGGDITPLLSGPLTTAAAGGMACSRSGGGPGLENTACAATLINTAITAAATTTTGGVILGVTSGTASSCKNLWVNITFVQ